MKLLIIEDERITRISLSDILKTEGYQVFSAEDGEEGLNIFRKELPDVVITDLRLPKLNFSNIIVQTINYKI